MYLVTGATGNVGAEVARALADAGERVRALSRTASTAVAGADVVAADLDDPTSLRAALTGIRGVFLLPGFSDMDAVMAEIQRAGVEHVVLLSGASAATGNTGNAIAAYMIRSEQALRRSALNWTILRPSAFMSNALRWVPQLRASDTVREPFAHIAAAVIDPADIAAVAADALHAPEGHRHAVHPLTGPHALTPARRLAILAETLGRDLRLEPLSNDDARSQLERDMPAAYVDAFFDFYVDGTLDESTIHPTVETILGRPPRTFEQWARDHKEGVPMTAASPRRAGRREWLALAVLALPCIVYAMDLTVLHLAVPSISADLGPTATELLWIVDIYGFVTAGLLVTMGTLGDRIGRRRLLLIGSATFAAASIAAAFATSVEMLIAARALLGAAGATLAPSTLSLIRELFHDPRQRTTAVGVWIASFSTGAAIGPLAGGVLLEHFAWGSVFLAAVPVMALVLTIGPRLLPEYRAPQAGRIDALSVVLSIAVVLPVVFGLKHLARDGWDLTGPAALGAGIVLALAFARRQRRLDDPLLDLRLFGSRGFNAALAANGLGFFVNFGFALFVAQYLQAVLGLSTLTAGLWSLPSAVAFIVGSMLTPKAVERVPAPTVVAAGLAIASGGFAVLTQVGAESGLSAAVGGSALFALGLSAVFTLAADLMVGSAPPQRAGAASAVAETSSELGGALGIAVLGAIGAAVYRGDLPTGAADTVGQAVLAGGNAADAAREAFVHGMQVAAGVSAAVVLAAAAALLATLHRSDATEPTLENAAGAGATA